MCSNNEKKDFFGRPVGKERFPYYPYSVIIPRCGPGPPCPSNRNKKYGGNNRSLERCSPPDVPVQCRGQQIRPRPQSAGSSATGTGSLRRQGHNNTRAPTAPTTNQKKMDTKELCRRIAEIVAQEIPDIDDKFLKEIQQKCKLYWDCLIKHNVSLNEEAVFQELTTKIRAWVGNNSLHERKSSQSQSITENTGVEFVESEEDLEELYGMAVRYSTNGDSQQFLHQGGEGEDE